jgi:hypothetical protein
MRCHSAAASGRRQPRPRPLSTVGQSHLQSDVASTHNQGTSRGSLQRKKVIAGGAHTIHHQQWHTGDAQRVNPVGWTWRGVRDGHQRTGTTTTTRRHIRRDHHTEHPASRHTLRSLGPRPPGRLGSGAFRRQRPQCDSKTRPPPAQHSTAHQSISKHITARRRHGISHPSDNGGSSGRRDLPCQRSPCTAPCGGPPPFQWR